MANQTAKYRLRMLALIILTVLGQSQSAAQSSTENKTTAQQTPGETSNDPSQDENADTGADESPVNIFPHSQTSRYWISGQINTILQWHPSFRAKYSGDNSLRPQSENAMSRVMTLYTGFQLTKKTEILFDVESAGGRGISDAFGLAGFTNLDVVRNPTLGSKPYLARLMIHQIIPLSSVTTEAMRVPLSLATKLPALSMTRYIVDTFFENGEDFAAGVCVQLNV